MRLVEVFGTNVQHAQFGEGRRRAQAAFFHIRDLVVGDEMLGATVDRKRERLHKSSVTNSKPVMRKQKP